MTNTQEIDLELDAIDWDHPTCFPSEDRRSQTSADQDPALYQFITVVAELITDDDQWNQFTTAFNNYQKHLGRR